MEIVPKEHQVPTSLQSSSLQNQQSSEWISWISNKLSPTIDDASSISSSQDSTLEQDFEVKNELISEPSANVLVFLSGLIKIHKQLPEKYSFPVDMVIAIIDFCFDIEKEQKILRELKTYSTFSKSCTEKPELYQKLISSLKLEKSFIMRNLQPALMQLSKLVLINS